MEQWKGFQMVIGIKKLTYVISLLKTLQYMTEMIHS